jgi:hypothetical protein
MLNLSSLKYLKVLEADGGPVAEIRIREFPVNGEKQYLANARLRDELVGERPKLQLYSAFDGSGLSVHQGVARSMAISEALERWAFHAKVRAADRELYGFDVDESSNGMAAFPGLFAYQARSHAFYEAVERVSVMGWWEGLLDGEMRATPWLNTSAVVIPNPVGKGCTVITVRSSDAGYFSYGTGAGADYKGALRRAMNELARNDYVLGLHRTFDGIQTREEPKDLFERRCLYFSTDKGFAEFNERIQRRTRVGNYRPAIACDTEIRGPWTKYATVWRVLIPPPSQAFMGQTERYFFW